MTALALEPVDLPEPVLVLEGPVVDDVASRLTDCFGRRAYLRAQAAAPSEDVRKIAYGAEVRHQDRCEVCRAEQADQAAQAQADLEAERLVERWFEDRGGFDPEMQEMAGSSSWR